MASAASMTTAAIDLPYLFIGHSLRWNHERRERPPESILEQPIGLVNVKRKKFRVVRFHHFLVRRLLWVFWNFSSS
jgi:hypothetical protein